MTILILHGIEGHAGIHWQQWLHDRLSEKGHRVIMPELPKSDHPDRAEWLKTAQKTIEGIDLKDLIIVGHSLGVVTALDLIEDSGKPIKALISISGFSEDYRVELNSYFLKKKMMNFDKINLNLGNSFVFYGSDDPYVPQKILKSLADSLKVQPKIFSNGGHFNTRAGYTTFPELLETIEKLK